MNVFVLEMRLINYGEWEVIGVFKDRYECIKESKKILKEGKYDSFLISIHKVK